MTCFVFWLSSVIVAFLMGQGSVWEKPEEDRLGFIEELGEEIEEMLGLRPPERKVQ